MIQKLKYIFVACIIFCWFDGATQILNSWQTYNQSSNRLEGKLQGEIYFMSSQANNNFFLQKDWATGSITLTDGDVFDNVKLRYMTFGDELVAYNDNARTLFIVEKNTVKEFTFKSADIASNAQRRFINLDSLNFPGGKSYFEELYAGGAKLLAYHFVNELKVTPYIDNAGVMRDTEYKATVNYFLLTHDNGLFRIQRKKASFYKIYPEQKKQIRKLLRKNRVSLIGQSSLIQAFSLLDDAGILK